MRMILVAVVLACSGCGLMGDGVIVYGTPEGIRSLYDGQNALITNAKTQLRDGTSYLPTRTRRLPNSAIY